jgi:hypothetical protein
MSSAESSGDHAWPDASEYDVVAKKASAPYCGDAAVAIGACTAVAVSLSSPQAATSDATANTVNGKSMKFMVDWPRQDPAMIPKKMCLQ